MQMRPDLAAAEAPESDMMNDAEEWLEEEAAQNNKPNDEVEVDVVQGELCAARL